MQMESESRPIPTRGRSQHESCVIIRLARLLFRHRSHDCDGLWTLLLKQLGIPLLDFAFLGWWIGHSPEGQWIHEGIAKATPIRGELWMGWLAHYSI
jgi:hypothetical protein